MNIPKHVLNCPWVGQQHDILSFCEHLILILRLSSILSQNDNSEAVLSVMRTENLLNLSAVVDIVSHLTMV